MSGHPWWPAGSPQGTCSHEGFLWDAVARELASLGPVQNAGDQVVAGGLSPVSGWITQSQKAKAREELPGPAVLQTGLHLRGKCRQFRLN